MIAQTPEEAADEEGYEGEDCEAVAETEGKVGDVVEEPTDCDRELSDG